MLERKDPANRNITRMDYNKVKGYWVRVAKNSKLHQRLFSDNQYSSQDEALQAARTYRDQLREELFGSSAVLPRRVCQNFKGNTSGVVGVHYSEKQRGGKLLRSYVASWCPVKGGPQKHKYFSIEKFGDEEAFRLAVEHRQAMVSSILNEAKGDSSGSAGPRRQPEPVPQAQTW